MRRLVVLGLVLLGAGVACTSGSAKQADESSDAELQAAAEAVLITADDLPPKYELEMGKDEDDEPVPDFELTGECAEFNQYLQFDSDWIHSLAEAHSGDFEDYKGDGFSSNAAVFADAETAQDETDEMVRFFDMCSEQFEAAYVEWADDILQESAEEEGVEVSDLAMEISEIAVPPLGDMTHALRMDMTFVVDGMPVRSVTDSYSIRSGRMIATLCTNYLGEVEDSLEDLRDELAAIMAERLVAENVKLPE
jgi:hypothetical protein